MDDLEVPPFKEPPICRHYYHRFAIEKVKGFIPHFQKKSAGDFFRNSWFLGRCVKMIDGFQPLWFIPHSLSPVAKGRQAASRYHTANDPARQLGFMTLQLFWGGRNELHMPSASSARVGS